MERKLNLQATSDKVLWKAIWKCNTLKFPKAYSHMEVSI